MKFEHMVTQFKDKQLPRNNKMGFRQLTKEWHTF